MNNHKYNLFFKIILGVIFFQVLSGKSLMAGQMTAREVMMKNDNRYTGDTSIENSTMILIDKRGKQSCYLEQSL